jgi:hypothetical protein
MCSVHKLIKRTAKSEQGFVLIVAIMAIVIMIAIGFFALTMISGDLMISSRLASERQAFSAAETGAHVVFTALDLNNFANADVNNIPINPDFPNLIYTARTIPTNRRVTVPGFGTSSAAQVFQTTVTGRNSSDGSSVSIIIGVTPPPTPGDTIY